MLVRYHEASQELHSVLPPCINKRDIRHPNESVMTYNYESILDSEDLESPEHIRDGVGSESRFGQERTGVTHLVHAWHQKGHPVCILYFFPLEFTKHLIT